MRVRGKIVLNVLAGSSLAMLGACGVGGSMPGGRPNVLFEQDLVFNRIIVGTSSTVTVFGANYGDAVFELGGIDFVDLDSSDFTLTGVPERLVPGEQFSFQLTFSPHQSGEIDGRIDFAHRGESSNLTRPFDLDIRGRSIAPE